MDNSYALTLPFNKKTGSHSQALSQVGLNDVNFGLVNFWTGKSLKEGTLNGTNSIAFLNFHGRLTKNVHQFRKPNTRLGLMFEFMTPFTKSDGFINC